MSRDEFWKAEAQAAERKYFALYKQMAEIQAFLKSRGTRIDHIQALVDVAMGEQKAEMAA